LSALAGACEGGPPPEDPRPEITLETIHEDLNGERVEVPAEDGAAEPSIWRFYPNEPKEIEIVEKQLAGDRATFVIDLRTRTSPRAEQQGITKKLAGRLRLHYELQSGFALRQWEIVKVENISFAYQKE
jgi:TusA-related sulfurtransferase